MERAWSSWLWRLFNTQKGHPAPLSSFCLSLSHHHRGQPSKKYCSINIVIIVSDHCLCVKRKKIYFRLISRWRDSNSRPHSCKRDAPTTGLQQLHLMPSCRADHLAQLEWTSDFVSRGCGFTFHPICVKRNCQNFISIIVKCPCGLMDKASVSDTEDCVFESHHGIWPQLIAE